MNTPNTPFPDASLPPNLFPHAPLPQPEAPGPGDIASLSPFAEPEAQDHDSIIKQLVLDRPLKLYIPNKDLGYGLLLTAYTDDPANATAEHIQQAVDGSIPQVAPMFWAFRIMVAAGFALLVIFALSFYYSAKRLEKKPTWLLRAAVLGLPLPWIACEAGWFVAEYWIVFKKESDALMYHLRWDGTNG